MRWIVFRIETAAPMRNNCLTHQAVAAFSGGEHRYMWSTDSADANAGRVREGWHYYFEITTGQTRFRALEASEIHRRRKLEQVRTVDHCTGDSSRERRSVHISSNATL